MVLFVFMCMIFLHIVDDFYFQPGILSNLKQKDWWESQPLYCNKYKDDYLAAIFIHGLSWSFMTILPCALYQYFTSSSISIFIFITWIINAFFHAAMDDLKANEHSVNLIEDQFFHLVQILWAFYFLVYQGI